MIRAFFCIYLKNRLSTELMQQRVNFGFFNFKLFQLVKKELQIYYLNIKKNLK